MLPTNLFDQRVIGAWWIAPLAIYNMPTGLNKRVLTGSHAYKLSDAPCSTHTSERSKVQMSRHDVTRFSGPLGPLETPFRNGTYAPVSSEAKNGYDRRNGTSEQEPTYFHGEALARDLWAERYAPWIVLGYVMAFALFLVSMALAGQAPGQSFSLKSGSDIIQCVGGCVAFIFCLRIVTRLRGVALHLRRDLMQKEMERRAANELAMARAETQAAQRAYLAWIFLTIAVALYTSGLLAWASYDVRMASADVPFPGLYDIGFVVSYPFYLIGTLLLTRRNKATVGRTRLVLDASAVIGASLALSWFFLLGPSIAGLPQAPSSGAAFLSIYFPTGDLFLIAVGTFLMFSPLANRAQQSVFLCLCLGLFFLAITDSLLAYYSLSSSFNTGTYQDILWPLSQLMIGLAAIEYPRSIAREQEQAERANNSAMAASLLAPSRSTQFSTTAQTISPFILVLMTCALLLTVVAPRGGSVLIQADIVALALILIVIARQALTLLENNRLTMQIRGELVISRRELQVTRREADEATRNAQEKRILEEGVATLRAIHARVARGDFAARAPTVPGPLLPIAISLNLMLDRLGSLSQRGARYDQLSRECKILQEGIERLGQGLPVWPSGQQSQQSTTELRTIFLGLAHLQRIQESQWRRLASALDSMNNLTRRLREALNEIRRSNLFAELGQSNFERMVLERVIREVDLLEQQQQNLHSQIPQSSTRINPNTTSATMPDQSERTSAKRSNGQSYQQERQLHYQADGQSPFNNRAYQAHHIHTRPIEE
jgi:hypothetical protein